MMLLVHSKPMIPVADLITRRNSKGTTRQTEVARKRDGRQSSRLVRVAVLLLAGGSAVLAVVFASRFGTDPRLVTSPLIGQPVPGVGLPYLETQGQLDLDQIRGHVVVVNFWAPWCIPCCAEHNELVATAAAYEPADVRFVGVVYQAQPEDAINFLDELGRGDDYVYVTDPGSQAAIAFGVFGVPETFFVDRDGVIVGKITGPSNALFLGSTIDQVLRGERPSHLTAGTIQSGPGG